MKKILNIQSSTLDATGLSPNACDNCVKISHFSVLDLYDNSYSLQVFYLEWSVVSLKRGQR